jgi:outer membrane biosynthesis protein TonB
MAKKGADKTASADQTTVIEPLPVAGGPGQSATEPDGTLVSRLPSDAAADAGRTAGGTGHGGAPNPAGRGGQTPEPTVARTGPLGLDVVMRWSGELHRAEFFARPQSVTVGEHGHFALPDSVMGGKKLDTLVEADVQHQFALSLANGAMTGQVIVGSDVYAIGDIRSGRTPLAKDRIPLTATTHAFVEFGEFTFVLTRGAVPPPAKPELWDKEASLLLGAFLLSMLLLLGPVIASFQLAPPRRSAPRNAAEEVLENKTIEIEVVEEKKEEEPKPEDKPEEKQEAKNEQPIAPPQQQQQEQKQIDKEAKALEKALEAATPEEREAKKQELVKAEVDKATAAVDAALANVPTTKLAGLAEAGELAAAAGNAPALVLNTGDGADVGGRKGPGVGGDNDTGKQVASGLAKQATGGAGPKLNTEVKAKEQKVIRLGGQQSADGELPPEVIKKVLADKSGALKACYQKELQSNPDLAGSIKVKFMIGPNGAVVGVKIESSTIDNSKVEECITAIIKSLRFSQAKGGGNTTVNKTFTFKSN